MNDGLNPQCQQILDAAQMGIFGLDKKGIITFCNDALLKMIGREREEAVGHDAYELLHHSRPDGSSYPAEQCAFKQALAARCADHFVGEQFWRKDGSCFPVEYWLRQVEHRRSRLSRVARTSTGESWRACRTLLGLQTATAKRDM